MENIEIIIMLKKRSENVLNDPKMSKKGKFGEKNKDYYYFKKVQDLQTIKSL